MGKLIVTAAITGAIHTPSMSPHLPLTPEQIIDECIASAEAGAVVAHIHSTGSIERASHRRPDGLQTHCHGS